jgi:hypothetical protein
MARPAPARQPTYPQRTPPWACADKFSWELAVCAKCVLVCAARSVCGRPGSSAAWCSAASVARTCPVSLAIAMHTPRAPCVVSIPSGRTGWRQQHPTIFMPPPACVCLCVAVCIVLPDEQGQHRCCTAVLARATTKPQHVGTQQWQTLALACLLQCWHGVAHAGRTGGNGWAALCPWSAGLRPCRVLVPASGPLVRVSACLLTASRALPMLLLWRCGGDASQRAL